MSYICAKCGQSHEGAPLSFAADYPDEYFNLTVDDRDIRAIIGSDQCVVDSERFYLRGILEIPIHEREGDPFLWGLWARIHEADYDEISDCWEQEGKELLHGPFKGRLANSILQYPETLNLKLTLKLRPLGKRPLFEIDEREHPLAISQRVGLSLAQAYELAGEILHGTIRKACL